eukprot:TRINITY_DN3657_c1_g4_i1.p1 TRINITY_DN3657_c1_g4~~TRINITY_DN3657_c1_g4_i1.p1  ORF type:complete len:185 (+),score=36.03 TRINITY_DN3657_c1_g4_i1:157-711(+)
MFVVYRNVCLSWCCCLCVKGSLIWLLGGMTGCLLIKDAWAKRANLIWYYKSLGAQKASNHYAPPSADVLNATPHSSLYSSRATQSQHQPTTTPPPRPPLPQQYFEPYQPQLFPLEIKAKSKASDSHINLVLDHNSTSYSPQHTHQHQQHQHQHQQQQQHHTQPSNSRTDTLRQLGGYNYMQGGT